MRIPLWVLKDLVKGKVPFTRDYTAMDGSVLRARMLKVADEDGERVTVCDFELNPGDEPSVPGLLRDLEAQVEQLEAKADCQTCFGGRYVDSMLGPVTCPTCVKDD